MRVILALCMVFCIFGCAKSNNMTAAAISSNSRAAALQKADKLIKLADSTPPQQATSYKLQALEQLIAAGEIDQAEYSINEDFKSSNLDNNHAAHKQIILAQIELAKRNMTNATQHLRNIWTPAKLPEDLLVKFYKTRAEIYYRSGKVLDAVQERVYLSKHLRSPEEQIANNEAIWDLLVPLTPNALKSMPRDQAKNDLNGWLEFATISKQYDASSEQLNVAYNQWHALYPQHPAGKFRPTNTNSVMSFNQTASSEERRIINTPKKIALMLPLQGPHAKSAGAIRDGFLSAFYAQKDGPNKPSIQVYDTTTQDLQTLYKQIIEQGTDFIVGPLTKDEVDAISSSTKSAVPMLALNSTSKTTTQDNILQFSLSPELEAQAVARKAWHDGQRNAVIITPKSAWGKRMYAAFEKAWLAQGGNIIGAQEISAQADITNSVKKLLAIDASEARAQKLKQNGFKFAFDPRRRQDIDMIFIATNAALARQVKPLLNFYFAGNVPAYASSSIYSGKVQPTLDQDLNGIQFCDMPWILDNSIAARDSYKPAAELEHSDFDQYARLYALGLDAYKIALQIEQLTMMPDLGISGMTGMLTLDKQQYIERKLMWASFKKGQPQVHGEQL